jgi:hypothetical protein
MKRIDLSTNGVFLFGLATVQFDFGHKDRPLGISTRAKKRHCEAGGPSFEPLALSLFRLQFCVPPSCVAVVGR